MSTLEIVCTRCEKKFRVRAEFAGRSTRCPACSAPITIGGAARTAGPTPLPTEEDRPKPRPRPKDDDERPRRRTLNWSATDQAFRREQMTVIFAFLSIFGAFLTFCILHSMRAGAGDEPILLLLMLIFGLGPALATAAFGLIARVAALGTPHEALTRGSTIASLFCAISAVLSLVVLAISRLSSMDSPIGDPLPAVVATGAFVLSILGALFTFGAFTSQVGIYQRSPAISRGLARLGITVTACLIVLIGIGVLYTLVNEFTDSSQGFAYSPIHDGFFSVMTELLMPLAFGVCLILYHRLLAAGRRAINNEPPADLQD